MKKAILLVVVLGIALGAGPAYRHYQKSRAVANATERVQDMLRCMAQGTGTDQAAMRALARWAENKYRITDRDKLDTYSVQFDRFRQAKGLYRAFDRYEVTSAEWIDGQDPPLVEVSFDVEGRSYTVDVVDGEPIAWTTG